MQIQFDDQKDTSRFKKDDDDNVIVSQDVNGDRQFYRLVRGDEGWEKEYFNPSPNLPNLNDFMEDVTSSEDAVVGRRFNQSAYQDAMRNYTAPPPPPPPPPDTTPVGGLSSLITAPIMTPSGHEDETGTYVGDSPTADVMPPPPPTLPIDISPVSPAGHIDDNGAFVADGTPIGGTAPDVAPIGGLSNIASNIVTEPAVGTTPDVAPVGGLTSLLPSAPEVPTYKDPATLIPIKQESPIQYDDEGRSFIPVIDGEGSIKRLHGEEMENYLASYQPPEPAITRSIEPTPEVSPATDIPKIASTVVTSIDPATEPSIAPPPNPPPVVEQVTPENKVLLPSGGVLNNSAGGRGQATLKLLADGEDGPSVEDIQKADFLGLLKDKIFYETSDDGQRVTPYTLGTDEDPRGKNYNVKNIVNEAYQNWNTNLESATKVYGAGKADWTYEDVYNGLGARGNFDINNLWGGSKSPPRITDWGHIGPTQKEATFTAGQTRDDLWNIQQDLINKGITPPKNPDQIALEFYKQNLGDGGSEYGYGLGVNTKALTEMLKQQYLNQPEVVAARGSSYKTPPEKIAEITEWGKRHEAEIPQVIEQLKEAQKDANRMTFGDYLPMIFMSAATAGMGAAAAPMFEAGLAALGVGATTAATAAPIVANATFGAFRAMNEGEDFGKAFLQSGITQYAGGELFNQAGGVISDMVSAGIPEEAAKAIARSTIGAITSELSGGDAGIGALTAGARSLTGSATGNLTSSSSDIDSQQGGYYGDQEISAIDQFKNFLADSPIATKAVNAATNAGATALAAGKDVGTAVENALINVGISSGLNETGLSNNIANMIAPVVTAQLTGGNVGNAALNSINRLIIQGSSDAVKGGLNSVKEGDAGEPSGGSPVSPAFVGNVIGQTALQANRAKKASTMSSAQMNALRTATKSKLPPLKMDISKLTPIKPPTNTDISKLTPITDSSKIAAILSKLKKTG